MRLSTFLLVSAACISAAAWTLSAQAAPVPNEVPTAWQLDFDHREPMTIRVAVPGEDAPRLYWYMIYRVTNRTGEDRLFIPNFELYTRTGDLIRSGQNINPAVFAAIKKRHGDPLLRDRVAMAGKLLQGEDNSRIGVAIFENFDPEAAEFDIFVGGISGETAEIELPEPIAVTEIGPDGEEQTVMKDTLKLNKQLRLRYQFGREAADRAKADPAFVEETWVMR